MDLHIYIHINMYIYTYIYIYIYSYICCFHITGDLYVHADLHGATSVVIKDHSGSCGLAMGSSIDAPVYYDTSIVIPILLFKYLWYK